MDADASINVFDMFAHGTERHIEFVGKFLVRKAGGTEHTGDFALARGEARGSRFCKSGHGYTSAHSTEKCMKARGLPFRWAWQWN